MQKKSPIYTHVKEETVWLMDRFNNYVNEKFRQAKGLPRDWVYNSFTVRFLFIKSTLTFPHTHPGCLLRSTVREARVLWLKRHGTQGKVVGEGRGKKEAGGSDHS